MKKSIFVLIASVGTGVVLLPLLAAFEAHVINVTARIENALAVTTDAIDFGTVFPQEHLEKSLEIALSDSFMREERVDDIEYFIRQKPKCAVTTDNGKVMLEFPTVTGHVSVNDAGEISIDCGLTPEGMPNNATWGVLPSLCEYISKKGEDENDETLLSFHKPWKMEEGKIVWKDTKGRLTKSEQDTVDNWIIDLAVPCFGGNCAQDWEEFVRRTNPQALPANQWTQLIENEHKIFGCDLWVEVSGISQQPLLPPIPIYLLNPFDSSLKIDVLNETVDTSDRKNVHLFDFQLSDSAPSPYEGTQFTHAPNEEIQVRRIKFTKIGTLADGDITSIRLMNLDTGYILQTLPAPTGGFIEFNLPVDSSKPDFGVMVSWHSYGVIVEMTDFALGTLQLSIASANDIDAYDYRNDARVATITNLNTFPIVGASTLFDMPSIVQDNFNSYTDGSIVGQGSWINRVNGDNFVVQGALTQEGAKALHNTTSADSVVTKTGIARTNGKQAVYVRTENIANWGIYNDGNAQVRISKTNWDSEPMAAVSFKKDGHVAYYDPISDTYTNFDVYNNNEWTLLEIEWRSSDKMARYRINSGTWTNWKPFRGAASFTDFDTVGFDFVAGGTGGVYFDKLH